MSPIPISMFLFFPGDHGEAVTPVPIPNTEVKGLSGDGTAASSCGRVARCRVYFLKACEQSQAFFYLSPTPRHNLLDPLVGLPEKVVRSRREPVWRSAGL